MRQTLMYLAIFWPTLTWAAADRNLNDCESVLSAPASLKQATVGLLSPSAGAAQREQHMLELKRFVDQAQPGSADLVQFLGLLMNEEPSSKSNSIDAFSERLFIRYLTKPGNESFALDHLPVLLDCLWLNYIYGDADNLRLARGRDPGKFQEDSDVIESILQLTERLTAAKPMKVREEWWTAENQYLDDVLKVNLVRHTFLSTMKYLEYRSGLSRVERAEEDRIYDSGEPYDFVIERRQRLAYIASIIAELDKIPKDHDAASLSRFYFLPLNPFPGNETFIKDMAKWRGGGGLDPVETLVFLVRLGRRMPANLYAARFGRLWPIINRIKRLNQQFGPGTGT